MGVPIDPGQTSMMKNGDFEQGHLWWASTASITFADGKVRYSTPGGGLMNDFPHYLYLTLEAYRVELTIDSINNAKIQIELQNAYSPWYTLPGTKTIVLTPRSGEPAVLKIWFKRLNDVADAVIDSVRLDRIGELIAVTHNFIPDPEAKFEAAAASEDRQHGRIASWKDKSRILFLYDPAEE